MAVDIAAVREREGFLFYIYLALKRERKSGDFAELVRKVSIS